jgi:hypothetical protein
MFTSETFIDHLTDQKIFLRNGFSSSKQSTTESNTHTLLPTTPTTQQLTSTPTTEPPATPSTEANICYPKQVALPSSKFYSTFIERRGLLDPPALQFSHHSMCEKPSQSTISWRHCLPITGRKDQPFCTHPDRMDLLKVGPNRTNDLCFGSILHMLMVDLYEEFRDIGAKPTILYGTVLGAVRDKGIIPFTEDIDMGYVDPTVDGYSWKELQDRLEAKGYYLFDYIIWRVCIAPSHPLASILYDPNYSGLVQEYHVPYVDLYSMKPIEEAWKVQETKLKRLIPKNKFEPYSKVVINNVTYDSLADPVDLIIHEYGEDYMIPKPREGMDRR